MRSKELDLKIYNTDKITAKYLEQYDEYFTNICSDSLNILELGIREGGSLLLWKDYFPKSSIAGIDIVLPEGFNPDNRIRMFKGSQADLEFLKEVTESNYPEGYDIIIDDASHVGELTKRSFWFLFDKYLKSGGIYVIEDWGTGYWNDWPDGKSFSADRTYLFNIWKSLLFKLNILRHVPIKKPIISHMYGMVGFIKELIDEQGVSDLSKRSMKNKPARGSKFKKIVVTPHIVFIFKA